jgi:hypothetical protein
LLDWQSTYRLTRQLSRRMLQQGRSCGWRMVLQGERRRRRPSPLLPKMHYSQAF